MSKVIIVPVSTLKTNNILIMWAQSLEKEKLESSEQRFQLMLDALIYRAVSSTAPPRQFMTAKE